MNYLVPALLVLTLCIRPEIAAAGHSRAVPSQISTNVVESCRFSSTSLTLSFGDLDPGSNAPATASVTTQFWCTKGTSATISNDRGLYYTGSSNRMKNSGGPEYIPYTLTLTASSLTGGGKNVARDLSLDGYISNSDFINALVGDYSDTVELRITP